MEQNASQTTINALEPLLNQWGTENSEAHFTVVVKELFEGTSTLLLPVEPEEGEGVPEGRMRLSSIFDMEGLLVLGAFSTEEALYAWAGSKVFFTSMPSQEVLDFCQAEGIGRIVINSNQPNMFVLERENPNVATKTLDKDMQVRIGPLPEPLSTEFIEKLKVAFAKIAPVSAVYAYGQLHKKDMSCVLGIQLSAGSENTTKALHQAFSDLIQGETLPLPISLMEIENDEWLETVQSIEGALVYQR